ncbi:MAG: ferrous iron transport protein B [Candidatus Aminicenantes bacterium]|nr:ferrous iron transport protein B [Candidatus Aminicenantes bacterium]
MTKLDRPVIIFIGQPNSGKSTLFNAIAGYKAQTSNFPGTTVSHTHSEVYIEGKVLRIVDLPGTYSLNPVDPAERAALAHLFQEPPDLIVNVIDASLLGRSLELTLELLELERPLVVALNMVDLAEKKGVKIEISKLASLIGVPVVATVANRGRGIKELLHLCLDCLEKGGCRPVAPRWAADVEKYIQSLVKSLPPNFCGLANPRFTAIKLIEAGDTFCHEILEEISPELKIRVEEVRRQLEALRSMPAYEVLAAERHHLALKLFEKASKVERGRRVSFEEKLDSLLMHPFIGYPILIFIFALFFFLIFIIGNPLEQLLLKPWSWLNFWIHHQPGPPVLKAILDGLSQGVGAGLAIVFPYFLPLLLLMSFLEDLGYLARAGFLLDALMHRIGLHGKSVAPFILGFGCNVPAIMGTRILESSRDRLLTSLLIPFIPCSARTAVILAIVAFFLGPWWALGYYLFHFIIVAFVGRLLASFFKEPSPGLILEIPSLKIPSIKTILTKVLWQLRSFIQFAWPVLIAGSLGLSCLQLIGLDHWINQIFKPLVKDVLGLPANLGVTLMFGFLRKELSLLMMLQALGIDYLSLPQTMTRTDLVVFTAFVSLFIPCLSTVVIIWKEISWRAALLSILLNLTTATLIGSLLRLLL